MPVSDLNKSYFFNIDTSGGNKNQVASDLSRLELVNISKERLYTHYVLVGTAQLLVNPPGLPC